MVTQFSRPNTSMQIAGYDIVEQIYKGSRTLVYRAVQPTSQCPVVIKVLRNEHPSFSELVQFRNQYAIAQHLDIPGIVQPLSLAPHNNGYALVMEDSGGISLRHFTQGKPLAVDQFFPIALQITDVLHQLYQHRVIHKDIKPANILIQPETQVIKLIDFSIASLLPRETQEIQNPNGLEGTLAYLSPEQTGRMNRGIDYRSDFYSLGVTFFELLAGQLPFQTHDPMELLHCHLAKPPMSVCEVNPDLPFMLGEIVRKLMAKNAEDRYQSALGLQHDLQQCQEKYRGIGLQLRFDLGARDISDRFLIPEKLYGRESEVQTLLNAFGRVTNGATELMLVAGFSGIGKTAVVNEVHKPIVRWRGYFIKGKYDQFNRDVPFSAFVQAFRDLMGQLLSETNTQVAQWRTQILNAVGENGQVLIDVIPELEQIIGQQPPAPELSGSAAQNRFNILFQKFIAVFTTPEHPLVMFLDDLQWADSASLNLLKLLLTHAEQPHLFVIGAYRDNEVFPAHPLMLALDEIQKSHATIETLTLAPLRQSDVNQLIADALSCRNDLALPFTELVYQKTSGNPFFTTQFLKALHEDGLMTFDWEAGSWQCDLATVRSLALTDDVVEFMALQLQKLPSATQTVLKLAACIGAQFDLQTLSIVSEQAQTEVAAALWKALQEGLILPITETYKFFQNPDCETSAPAVTVPYKFLHDRVQQAAYSLIPEDHKQATHLKIGQLLLNNTPAAELDGSLFEIVNQLNVGKSLVIEPSQQIQFSQLNLKAGHKARAATAYAAAYQYAATGIGLLNACQLERSGWQAHYDLALPLHELAAETAYLIGHMTSMEEWAELVLQRATTAVDKMGVYATKIQAYMAQAKKLEALNIGLEALELLGVSFPTSPTPADIEQALTQTANNLHGENIGDLINLPMATDAEKLAIAKMLSSVGPPTYQATPIMFPLVICELVNLSLKYGNSPFSGYGYACYGIFLDAIFQDPDSAYQFGQLALKLSQHFHAPDMKSSVFMAVGVCTTHIKVHVKEVLSILHEGYQSGLEGGNFEFPAYCAVNKCHCLYLLGQELSSLEREIETVNDALVRFKQANTLAWNQTFQQSVLNLRYTSENPCHLEGIAYDEKISLPQLQEADHSCEIFYVYFNKLVLCSLFENHQKGRENALKAEQYLDALQGTLATFVFRFYDSLAHLAVYQYMSDSEQEHILSRVTNNQEKMRQWAHHAPMNFQHKYDLVAAEQCRVLGDKVKAADLYDRAIAGAKANEYTQEEALANELAAKFYLNWGRDRIAQDYMIEAYYGYARWGAKTKLAALEARYPQLLTPILQQTHTPLSVSETVFASGTATSSSTSSSSVADALDLSVVLKASQTLSSEMELEKLLASLLSLVIKEAGASKCVLMLWRDERLLIKGSVSLGTEPVVLQNIPIAESQDIPLKLIHRVGHQQQIAVLVDATADPSLANDPYIMRRQPKSILCNPIVHQGKLNGILYLENELVVGAFTKERVELLNLLCTQAAISLENSRLYEQAQQYAQQLEASQLQIVQNEKMATLGNLVAGVAHEVNNPVGFLNGSIKNAKDYVKDLFDYLDTYQQEQPPVEGVAELAEDIDLEFLLEDLPKLLESMQGATDRIKGISNSLRTFSRADTEHKVSANLHEGLESTLLILKYRLKANEHRPAIEVIQNYGELPAVECFPGQLNQVFMNILANAIDMFDELAQQSSFEDLKKHPQRITIQTAVLSDQNGVEIRIKDNGKGMSEEVRSRIFDHLFTTKGVGKGTGLGLAIAHQIVTETHSGQLMVKSVPGQGSEFIIQLSIAG